MPTLLNASGRKAEGGPLPNSQDAFSQVQQQGVLHSDVPDLCALCRSHVSSERFYVSLRFK